MNMKKNKLSITFFPDSHKSICEFGLDGRWLGEKRCRCDGLQALSDRRLYFMYVGGRKVKQSAQMRFSEQAFDRLRTKLVKEQCIQNSTKEKEQLTKLNK
jgi:hypothetical protein